MDDTGRRAQIGLRVEAFVIAAGRQPARARVFDASDRRCRLQTLCTAQAGESVRLQIADIVTVNARVVWAFDMFAELAFTQPLHPRAIAHVAARHTALTAGEAAELRTVGLRCGMLAERCAGHEEAAHLMTLARDCRVEAALSHLAGALRTRRMQIAA